MTDLRALLTRAGEATEPLRRIPLRSDMYSDAMPDVAFVDDRSISAADVQRARALHAEITAALAEDSTPPNSLDDPAASPMTEAGSGRVVGFKSQPEAPSFQPAPDDGWRPFPAPNDVKIEVRGIGGIEPLELTHWRPLPPPPAERKE